MSDFVKLLVNIAEEHANSRGYDLSAEFEDFLIQLIGESQSEFDVNHREHQIKLDLAKRNVRLLIDRIIQKLPPDEKIIKMHEWIHGLKDWICPLFPFC